MSSLAPLLNDRPAAHAPALRVTTATTLAELDALAQEWDALRGPRVTPIDAFEWSRSCAETVARRDQLRALVVWRGEHLAGVAPLAIERSLVLRRASMLGVAELQEPMDLVAADRRALDQLCQDIVRLRRPVVLGRLPSDSPTLDALKAACQGRAALVTRPQANAPYITLDASWNEPEKKLNSGRRSDLRRAQRKGEQLGPLKTDIITPRESDLEALLDLAFAIESKSWKGTAGTALALDAERQAFYRNYARTACRQKTLRLCFLYFGETPVAMQIALEQDGGFWLLKVGYDEEHRQASPGQLLMLETLRYAAGAGLTSYEFLGRAEAWTKMWTTTERQYVSARIYPYGARGAVAMAIDSAKSLGRKQWNALRRRWSKQ